VTTTPRSPARNRTGIAMLCLAVAAIALQRGATRPWLASSATDGAAISASPIGLVRVEADGGVTECRWWPRLGDEGLCTVLDEAAMATVRRAYPLVIVALWTSVAGLFLAVLAVPRQWPWLPAVVAAGASALIVTAIWSLGHAPRALSVLASAPPWFSGGGIMAVGMAAVLTTFAAVLLLDARRVRR